MKHLVLSTLLFGIASTASGCIIVDDDDDPPPYTGPIDLGSYDTKLLTSWKLVSGKDKAPATCQPGRNAAATLYTCPGDPSQCTNPASQAFVDIGDCKVGQGEGFVDVPYANDPNLSLPPGRYTVWYEFSADNRVYSKSLTKTIDLVEGRTEDIDFEVQVGHGFFDLAWMLTKGAATLQCADVVGQGGIALDTTLTGTQTVVASEWDCPDGEGRSYATPFNTPGYVNVATVIAGNGDSLGTSLDKTAPNFQFGNEAQDLGTVAIEVD